MICKNCSKKMHDLTHGKGKHRNYYCGNWGYNNGLKKQCKTHNWKGKWFTHQEWEDWINEV